MTLNILSSSKLKINLLTINYKQFLYCFIFLKNLNFLFNHKGFFICDNILNVSENKIYITLYVLIQHFKFLFYKRKSKVKFKVFYTKSLIKKISSLFYKQLFILKSNLIVFNIRLLNKQIKKVILKLLVNNFKKFKNILFIRRFNFFIDFLKMTALFLKAAIPLNTYVLFLGQIFKYLTKRHHNRFISFLKYLFQTLLTYFKTKLHLNPILGVKCLLKGRLRGKDRASSSIIKVGVIPVQSLGKKIFFHKIHIYTIYGVYGLKVWLYRL